MKRTIISFAVLAVVAAAAVQVHAVPTRGYITVSYTRTYYASDGTVKTQTILAGNTAPVTKDEAREAAPGTQPSGESEAVQPAIEVPSVIKSVGPVSAERLQGVAHNYSLVPQALRNRFESEGWTIYVASDIGPRFGFSTIRGVTRYSSKSIWIDDRKVAENAIIHEIGHFAFYLWPGNFDPQELENIRAAEVEAFRSFWETHHANTDTWREYAAESFQAYIENPAGLETHCPRTYEFQRAFIDSTS